MSHLIDPERLKAELSRAEWVHYLPWLLRNLIWQEVGVSSRVDFPIGREVFDPGFDGFVDGSGVAFVPDGQSVWEASTARRVRKKADEDFQKRSSGHSDLNRSECYYVGVNTNVFREKRAWIEEKKALNIWRDVKFYDFDNLHEWIEQYPRVAYLFGSKLRLINCTIETPDSWLSQYNDGSPVKIQPSWFVAGREDSVRQLIEIVKGTPRRIVLGGMGREESLVFLASACMHNTDDSAAFHLSKLVVISDPTSFAFINTTIQNSILALTFELEQHQEGFVDSSNAILYCGDRDAKRSSLDVPRVSVFAMADRMRQDGIDSDLATRASYAARKSFALFQRAIGDTRYSPFTLGPISRGNPRVTTALLLLNRWSMLSGSDLAAIGLLTDVREDEWINVATELNSGDNPILGKIGDTWYVTDIGQALDTCLPFITSQLMDDFRTILKMVLLESDPSFALPADERWKSSFLVGSRDFSGYLRDGLARTLTCLAEFEEPVGGERNGQLLVDKIVNDCLDGASPERWYSLASYLPLLAEASPEAFLIHLECDLVREKPQSLAGLVAPQVDLFRGGSRDHYLFWALECLAWSPKYFERAVLALASISSKGVVERTGNNPDRSLREIFLPWHPGTNVNASERNRVLRKVYKTYPLAARPLLFSLLPEHHSVSHPTYRPRYRDFGPPPSPVTMRDMHEVQTCVFQLLLEDSSGDPIKLARLAESVAGPDTYAFDRVVEALDSWAAASTPDSGTSDAWEILHRLLTRHTKYSESDWALPVSALSSLRAIVRKLTPTDPIQASRWLFANHVDLGRKVDDYKKENRLIWRLRRLAVKHVFETSGITGLFDLANSSQVAWHVGSATARASVSQKAASSFSLGKLLGDTDTALQQFGAGYAAWMAGQGEEEWLGLQLNTATDEEWPPQAIASLYLLYPPTPALWTRLTSESDDTQQEYWKRVSAWQLPLEPLEALDYLLSKFVVHKRLTDFVDFLAGGTYSTQEFISSKLLVNSLIALRENFTDYIGVIGEYGEDIAQILRTVNERGDAEQAELAGLEFYFFPLIQHRYKPVSIERSLAADPGFLVEVVSFVFRNDVGDFRGDDSTDSLARLAWSILDEWSTLPISVNSENAGPVLRDWVDTCLNVADSIFYREGTLHALAMVLGRSPEGHDGAWPSTSVCEILEHLDSDSFDDECAVSRLNMRGITSRSLDAGGEPERILAAQYGRWAGLRTSYPRAMRMLKNMEHRLLREADEEDKDSARSQELH